MSLPTLNTRYRDIDPWFDLREFLVNGWESLYAPTCGVTAGSNVVHWSMILQAHNATSHIIASGIPSGLMPHSIQVLPAFIGTEPIFVESRHSLEPPNGGILQVPWDERSRVIGVPARLNISGTTSRRAA